MKKIVLIITFFGKFPFWFNIFLLSCKNNPEIKWILFSDSKECFDYPENVSLISFTVEDFCALASSKLGIEVILSHDFLYKICDYKPTFGLIYEDYIKEYDFWGHCDVDVIWGNIKYFINDDILSCNDIISSRIGRISGHFCLYKNEEKINKIFVDMPKAKELLKKYGSYQKLDEELFTSYLTRLTRKNISTKLMKFFKRKQFTPKIYWERVLTTSGKHQRYLIASNGRFLWKEGRTYNFDGTEMMYLHFHVLKKNKEFAKCIQLNCKCDNGEDVFFVDKEGICRI